jgi:4-hydroxy-2-oxoheptanedioate aldolase
VQVETAEGLANAEAIAATEGLDVVFVGPGDLSVSIDAIGPPGAARLSAAIETIISAALKHGKVAGIFCGRPEDVGRWAAKGASFFLLASDTMFLGAGVAAGVASARGSLDGA